MFTQKTRKELIEDVKFIYCNTRHYKWWFMSRKKLERLFNQWLTIATDINNSIVNEN